MPRRFAALRLGRPAAVRTTAAQAETGEPYGVLTWLLAMVASFVAAGTIVAKTSLGPADASTSSGAGTRHVAKLVRPKTMVDLFELMNLYIMFYTSLGLGSTILITQFFEFVWRAGKMPANLLGLHHHILSSCASCARYRRR